MTKHLRFLIVLLMTLVWSAGWAQTTIDFTNGLPADWSKTGTVAKVDYQNKSCIQLQSSASVTSPAFEDAYSSMKISLTRSNNGTNFTISYQIGNAAAVLIKTYTSSQVTKGSWKDYIIDIPTAAQVANCKFIFKSDQASYYISSIEFTKAGPSKTPTKVAFPAEYSNKTFTFTEGKLEGFTAPTATETNNVAGTIKYSSNNESAVKVNASTGKLSFPGYGEATITATFTPTDADTYAVSTDSYKVVNKADLGDFVFYESFDKCNGGEGWSGNAAGKSWDDTVFDNIGWTKTGNAYLGAKCIRIGKNSSTVTTPVISFTSDAMLTFKSGAWTGDNTEITVTVSDGTLIYGDNAPAKSVNIKLIDSAWNTYSMKISGTKSCKITFKNKTTSYRFFLDEVMVKEIATPTVENITLNESATNTLEAKTGVNVTLKRSMVENEWNTICLPFDVLEDQAKTVFGAGVKIAELDENSTGNTLSFKNVDAIKATIPYLIKPTIAAPAEGYKFEGVTIKDDGKGNVAPGAVMTEGLYGFVGVYNPVDATEDIKNTVFNSDCYAAFLGANNTIFKANVGGTMKGFRAYFAIPKDTAASALRVVIDGTATSIKNINSEVVESNAPVYNLQGQRVDGNNLTPGIYVKAGKKFVVK
ncbi:hypothetical protein [uncultured Prevotella sp.]|uniref:hypothetical protein n=1 Tax=uncultured Prevotella sp. TaxID=159272 RepID=UPI00263A255C|nr:hypothetical protein [uncultured Prevotella sp.]